MQAQFQRLKKEGPLNAKIMEQANVIPCQIQIVHDLNFQNCTLGVFCDERSKFGVLYEFRVKQLYLQGGVVRFIWVAPRLDGLH